MARRMLRPKRVLILNTVLLADVNCKHPLCGTTQVRPAPETSDDRNRLESATAGRSHATQNSLNTGRSASNFFIEA